MFQRFSRQQEAMHFADGMNAEHRAAVQVRPPTLQQRVRALPITAVRALQQMQRSTHRSMLRLTPGIKVCCAVLPG